MFLGVYSSLYSGSETGSPITVSAGGKPVGVPAPEDGLLSVTLLPAFPKLPLIFDDMQQRRSTAMQVENVSKLKQNISVMTEITQN